MTCINTSINHLQDACLVLLKPIPIILYRDRPESHRFPWTASFFDAGIDSAGTTAQDTFDLLQKRIELEYQYLIQLPKSPPAGYVWSAPTTEECHRRYTVLRQYIDHLQHAIQIWDDRRPAAPQKQHGSAENA